MLPALRRENAEPRMWDEAGYRGNTGKMQGPEEISGCHKHILETMPLNHKNAGKFYNQTEIIGILLH